jgi:catechol 2,3-dioxygenase-like lactoylglutathione lyase family enzyme
MIGRSIVTLYVADVDRAIKFYVETLGFKVRYRANEKWAEVDGPAITLGLHRASDAGGASSSESGRGSMSIGLEVEQPLEEVVAVLENRGVKLGPIATGAVRIVHFADPDGTPLYLSEPYKGPHGAK